MQKQYLQNNKDRFLNELLDFLKIPSVSADPKYKKDVRVAAEFVAKSLADVDADNVAIIETNGHPVVYADKIIDKKLPTILVYGHYDVQPADPIELWNSPPFEPIIKNEKIYARGSSDDKGQMYMHIKAFEMMMQTDSLPCNVKFLFEGEEEAGSNNLDPFVLANKDKLACDIVLVSDTGMIANDVPTITTGVRGMSYVEVEVVGPNRDLHSGMYGGAVANPINILCNMIASLHDENGKITIPGFYDDVENISETERISMAKAPFSLKDYKEHLDIEAVHGEEGFSTLERVSIRPTLDVNGIWGGYIGDGAKTVLPSIANAKISMRLVPNQNSEKITKLFKTHFENIAPKYVKVIVTPHHGGEPGVTPTDSIAYKAAEKALMKTFGKKAVPLRCGGSIPIVTMFEEVLGKKTMLLGFGLDSDAIHSPNEHFGLFNYYIGIETIPLFYKYFSELSKS